MPISSDSTRPKNPLFTRYTPDIFSDAPTRTSKTRETEELKSLLGIQNGKSAAYGGNDLQKKIQEVFGFELPDSGIVLLVGSPTSGIKEYLSGFSNAIRVRGAQLSSNETYNQLLGASAGYVGSDKVTKFITDLQTNLNAPIIIDGIEAAGKNQLSDFVTQIASGKITEKTGLVGNVDVSRRLVIFTLREDLQATVELTRDMLVERLLKLRNSQNDVIVPVELLDIANIVSLYQLSSRPEKIQEALAPTFQCPAPGRLKEAAIEFSMTNSDLFEIADRAVLVNREEGRKILLVDGEATRETRVLGRDDFIKFNESLTSYFGQDDAKDVFLDALALKVTEPSKRPTSLFCVGPPGIGKTEIAKRLGSAIGNYVRVDSNVVKSIQSLLGSGYEQGLLTKSLIKGEPAVILFDEIEKMPTEALLGLLQLLDEGRIYDAYLKEAWPIHDALIVCTSNAIKDPKIQPDEARAVLKNRFPEEFVDRLDFIVPFRHFSKEHKIKIATDLAAARKIVLDDDELDRVTQPESIRQIQLEIQNIQSRKARETLLSGKSR